MRIEIGTGSKTFHIPIPRFVLSSAFLGKWVLKHCAVDLGGMPPQAVNRLWKEIAALGKKYPGWVLVDVESADGETVKIIL